MRETRVKNSSQSTAIRQHIENKIIFKKTARALQASVRSSSCF